MSVAVIAQVANNTTGINNIKGSNELIISNNNTLVNPISNTSNSSLNIIWESDFTDASLWTLDNNGNWQPPTAYPSDGQSYSWNKSSQAWEINTSEG